MRHIFLKSILAAALLLHSTFAFADTSWIGASPSNAAPVCSVNPLVGSMMKACAARVMTAAGAVTVTTADYQIVVNKVSGAATTVNLYATPATNSIITIKDGKGDAATNNITVTPAAGNIDGNGTYPIKTNYGSVTLLYNGTQWNVIQSSIGQIGANSSLSNWTASAALPQSNTRPSCPDTAGNHLNYVNGTGEICGTSGSGSGSLFPAAFSPGLLTATSSTKSTFYKMVKAGTVQNLIGSALSLVGTSVTITLYDCGASTTCAGPTTIGSVTVSATGTAVAGTVSNPAIAAGDYLAFDTTGTITSADVQGTAMIQQN